MGNEESRDILHPDGKRIAWFWQSNTDQDPWTIPEDQRQWTPYTDEQAIILEKAYLEKREAADLGEYRVLIPSMIQYKKGKTSRQRRVMRKEIEESFRQHRFSDEPSKPKSVNSPFGTLNDFTVFLMGINSKCRVFEGLELGATANLCFMFNEKEFSTEKRRLKRERKGLEEALSEGILNEGQILGWREKNQAKEFSRQIAETIKNAPMSQTNQEIYKQLMRMYTQEKFLYKRVNALLREENWKDFSNLAPFIFYLAKAFQAKTLAPTPEEIKTWGCLYRGTTLSQDSLSFYDPSKTNYFTWYAFTSTTKDPAVADKFKSKPNDSANFEVLFTFDISDCDPGQLASVSKVSTHKSEQEVIIAPATLYEIISQEFQDNKCYIQLKVLPPNDVRGRMEQGEITLDGLRAKSLEKLKAKVMSKRNGFEICHQDDINMKDAVSILSEAKEVKMLTLRESVFEKFGLVGLFRMLQNKNLQILVLNQVTIKNEALSWLPKEPLKDLRYLHITSSVTEDQILPKLLDSLCGKSLQYLYFENLSFFAGELRPLISMTDSTNMINLEFTNCEFTPENIQDLEQAIPRMKLQYLGFTVPKASDLLQALSRILPQMTALKEFIFRTDEINQEAYHAFVRCLPETAIESLTLYGDINEEGAFLLADALAKSKVMEVCVSSTEVPEEIFLEIIVSRIRMNISISARFFSEEKNNFNRIIQLLCNYKIHGLKFEGGEIEYGSIYNLIPKLPETHLISLSLPKKFSQKSKQPLDLLLEFADHGDLNVRMIMEALKKVLKDSMIKEICLPDYSFLSIHVYFFLRKYKLKKIERDDLLKKILK